jgi:hypothetical protein
LDEKNLEVYATFNSCDGISNIRLDNEYICFHLLKNISKRYYDLDLVFKAVEYQIALFNKFCSELESYKVFNTFETETKIQITTRILQKFSKNIEQLQEFLKRRLIELDKKINGKIFNTMLIVFQT